MLPQLDMLARWADALEARGRETLSATPVFEAATPEGARAWAREFRDDFGHRRAIDQPFLAYLLGQRVRPAPDPDSPLEPAAHGPAAHTDLDLWWALHDDLGAVRARELLAGRGPELVDEPGVIEVRTEAMLCALHALAHLVDRAAADSIAPTSANHAGGDANLTGTLESLRTRERNAAAWLVQNIQPDNATQHPWAADVFALHAMDAGETDAWLYAQTLVHNAMIGRARLDRFSAAIVVDAARRLRRRLRARA